MPYMFPLDPCETHTYMWEDGEHDTCYRCGAETKNDRGEPTKATTANEITTQKKGDSMNYSTAAQIQPPAGFREITGNGPWRGEYHGPEAHSGNVEVSSRWNHLNREIEFDVYSTVDAHSNFDREELEAIPDLIKDVLAQIDQAHAVEVMTAHRVPRANPEYHTVTEIAVWCDTHKIDAVAAFAAYQELHAEEIKSWSTNA